MDWMSVAKKLGYKVEKKFPRPFTLQLKGKKNLVGAEIGTWKGKNAESMVRELDIKKLFLIDPYKRYSSYEGYGEESIETAETEAKERLGFAEDKISWIRKMSSDAASDITDNLDFVYIDGNHSYEFVKKDIETYYPKVKDGGLVGGDDNEVQGVTDAVMEFACKKGLRLHLRGRDWFFIKGTKINESSS